MIRTLTAVVVGYGHLNTMTRIRERAKVLSTVETLVQVRRF